MKTNKCGNGFFRGQRGFTTFELVVVIAVISILAVFALDRYQRLLVEVERTTLQQDLGAMRSAIGMQVAAYFLAGNLDNLQELIDSNPMDLLEKQPKNYLGVFSQQTPIKIEEGSWYYAASSKELIYLVRNKAHFQTSLPGPARARFKISPVYADKQQNGASITYIAGLTLQPIEPYSWLKTSN